MALIPMWKCDRDGKLFDDKKEAEKHDKLLELAANISAWLEESVGGLDEDTVENIGMLMATNKDLLMQALKGKPEVLLLENTESDDDDSNVTAISA
ncbi:Uncharacterised protein [BD1-7 clade bacterium]|uniref:DNA damage-inducible protein YebG n=1 Tax=BD1-7 clade bacterium TaxID=2029982 RepID=A0A5S9QR46_9GAMM|nr:Uncharacterised protein [BD1-7 clade bacterium]CAA0121804.1 Uncharacterised protein [BD1-7 clade bacterium]